MSEMMGQITANSLKSYCFSRHFPFPGNCRLGGKEGPRCTSQPPVLAGPTVWQLFAALSVAPQPDASIIQKAASNTVWIVCVFAVFPCLHSSAGVWKRTQSSKGCSCLEQLVAEQTSGAGLAHWPARGLGGQRSFLGVLHLLAPHVALERGLHDAREGHPPLALLHGPLLHRRLVLLVLQEFRDVRGSQRLEVGVLDAVIDAGLQGVRRESPAQQAVQCPVPSHPCPGLVLGWA